MKVSDIGYLKNRTELTSNFKNRKLSFPSPDFKNWLLWFGDSFSHCLIHNSSSSMIGSAVKVPFYCTSSSQSLWLTDSWSNSAWKYISFLVSYHTGINERCHRQKVDWKLLNNSIFLHWRFINSLLTYLLKIEPKKLKPQLILWNQSWTENDRFFDQQHTPNLIIKVKWFGIGLMNCSWQELRNCRHPV